MPAMEVRDTSAKIRLLPPDEPEGVPRRFPPRRRWVGPAFLAGGIVAFALLIGLWTSASSPTEPVNNAADEVPALTAEASTTSTTAPQEPTPATVAEAVPLLDQVPDLASELWLAGVADNLDGSTNVITVIWNGRLPAPAAANVFDRTFPVEASFAPNSRMLALVGIRRTDGVATLYVGSNSTLAPQFVGVTSYEWIHSDSLQVAFTGAPPGVETPGLYRADVAPSGGLSGVERIVDVSQSARLASAGDWGYLINDATTVASATLLDVDGTPLHAVAGFAFDATADGTVILASDQATLEDELAAGATLAELGFVIEPVAIGTSPYALLDATFSPLSVPQGIADGLGALWTEFSPDDTLLIGTNPGVGERWTVRTAALDGSLGRTTSVIGATAYLGWSSDGNYLMYATEEGMAFHNWDRGTTHYVAFDHDYELLAVGS